MAAEIVQFPISLLEFKIPELICSIPYNRKSSEANTAANDHQSQGENRTTVRPTTAAAGRRRKQSLPRRSADLNDPDFRGVYFKMETKFENHEPRIVVTSVLRVGLTPVRELRSGRRRRRIRRLLRESIATRLHKNSPQHRVSDSGISVLSDTDEDEGFKRNFPLELAADKRCISCGTTRTPLWRGAEQGTALCNACGIRYKKYKVRCLECWHVPRRDQNQVHSCSACGAPIR